MHSVTTREDIIQRITNECLDDFAADGVVYVELRTTPREVPSTGMTKESYVRAVLSAMSAHASQIKSKLIISVNRARGIQEANENVDLAIALAGQGHAIAGIDLSGDPRKGDFREYEDSLTKARRAGLKISVHFAEHRSKASEWQRIIDFRPDRLGHACYHASAMTTDSPPIECCVTSNLHTVPEFKGSAVNHPVSDWLARDVPFVLCTDDAGIFSTTLSREYEECALAFGWDFTVFEKLCLDAVEYAFAPETEKEIIRREVERKLSLAQRNYAVPAAARVVGFRTVEGEWVGDSHPSASYSSSLKSPRGEVTSEEKLLPLDTMTILSKWGEQCSEELLEPVDIESIRAEVLRIGAVSTTSSQVQDMAAASSNRQDNENDNRGQGSYQHTQQRIIQRVHRTGSFDVSFPLGTDVFSRSTPDVLSNAFVPSPAHMYSKAKQRMHRTGSVDMTYETQAQSSAVHSAIERLRLYFVKENMFFPLAHLRGDQYVTVSQDGEVGSGDDALTIAVNANGVPVVETVDIDGRVQQEELVEVLLRLF